MAGTAGNTCESLGFLGGTLKCSSDCLSFDTSGCWKKCGTGANEACPRSAGWNGSKCSSEAKKLSFKTDGNPEEPYADLYFPSNTDCSGKYPVCNCAKCNPGYEWIGVIAELATFDRALSPAESMALYKQGASFSGE